MWRCHGVPSVSSSPEPLSRQRMCPVLRRTVTCDREPCRGCVLASARSATGASGSSELAPAPPGRHLAALALRARSENGPRSPIGSRGQTAQCSCSKANVRDGQLPIERPVAPIAGMKMAASPPFWRRSTCQGCPCVIEDLQLSAEARAGRRGCTVPWTTPLTHVSATSSQRLRREPARAAGKPVGRSPIHGPICPHHCNQPLCGHTACHPGCAGRRCGASSLTVS
jgi:hypothetical protein